MTVFKFRLATLLRMREAVRDERRTALAEAYEADRILAERIEEMQQRHRALYDRRAEAAGPGAVKVDQLLDAGRYEFVLQAEQKTVASQRQQLSEEIEKRRTALAESDRDVRVLEKLRERQAERHRKEQGKLDQRQMDEAASQGYFRQQFRKQVN